VRGRYFPPKLPGASASGFFPTDREHPLSNNSQIQAFIDRLVGLHKERKQISEMITEVKSEAKNSGYDADAMSEIVKRVLMNEEKIEKAKQKEEIARIYAEAIGQMSLF
jgi:uncharacterized protein (UPF0335 family)